MNEDELKALVDELKAEKESLSAKNKELLGEVKKERNKSREIDADKFYALQDELESVKADNAKLSGDLKGKNKEFEKLQASLTERDKSLEKLIIDDGLTNALTSANVKAELLPAVKALLRGQAQLKDNQAMMGDKPLSEFMTEWVSGDGKHYITAPQNSGGGSNGGSGDTSNNVDVSKMTPNEMMRLGREQKQG